MCIAAFAIVAILVAGVVDAYALMPFGVGVEGRQFIPLTAMFLVLCGWTIQQGHQTITALSPGVRRAIRSTGLVSAICLVLLWLLAWLVNGRKSANGIHGSWNLLAHTQWKPPLGWDTWLVLAIMATLLGCGAAIAGFVQGTADPGPSRAGT
jgi:hypothetical protein